jgi:hypothetical protein
MQSCIKEDLQSCETELLLRFRYTLNNEYANLFYPEVNRITVYIFDSNGKYVDNFSEEGSVLTNEYVMHIPLPKGKYCIVAYGGSLETYTVSELDSETNTLHPTLTKGVTDVKDLRAELNHIIGDDGYLHPEDVPHDFYAGLATEGYSSMNNQNITEIDLIKNTKDIKVKINDPDNTNLPYEVYISDTNGRYHFDNETDDDHGIFKYKPINTLHEPNYMEVDLRKMRLMLDNEPMLVIKEKAGSRAVSSRNTDIVYNENMIDQILETEQYSTQEDLDREDEYLFEITLPSKETGVGIIVSVNGWIINDIYPDL